MTVQDYALYTPADQSVWSILYKRQIDIIRKVAYHHFVPGLEALGFNGDQIPDFEATNQRLLALTGWKIYAVPGLIPARQFFKLMKFKKFGATTWLRKMGELDYLEEPDMFHDVFGHVPLLADAHICDYLHRMATIANRHIDDEAVIEQIGRLYWFTVEFGLVKENDGLKIYGAGLLSSPGESAYCMMEEAVHLPFDLEKVLATPYEIDSFQHQYFVLRSMGELAIIIDRLDKKFPTQ